MNIPIMFRALASVSFTLVIFPLVDAATYVEFPSTMLMFLGMILEELFIGWIIGLVAFISFAAINLAGKVMDMQVGFAIVNVMDPTSGQQIPLIGSFLYNLAVMTLLITNGHHMIIAALVESFREIPLWSMQWNETFVNLFVDFTSGIFTTGMKIAMPVTFAILMVNVGMGILARTMPQMNIFVVGIPMHIIVGIFMLSVVVPFYIMFLDVVFDAMYGNISLAVKTLAP